MIISAPAPAAELVHRLFVLIKASAVYGPENQGYRTHAEEARASLAALLAEARDARLEVREDRLYFNDALIRLPPGDAGGRFLTSELARRGVVGVEFRGAESVRQLDAFVSAFNKTGAAAGDRFREFERLLAEAGAAAVVLIPGDATAAGAAAASDGQGGERPARAAFMRAVGVVETLMTGVREGREADFDSAKAAVAELTEQVLSDPQALFELAVLLDFDEYTYAHSVNVCVYSVAIGAALGLERDLLPELGFAALFHDIGKARLPKELINKPDELNEEDWRLMRSHPALGAQVLLSMDRPFDALLGRAASVAFEHHMGASGAGYPRLARPRPQDLFSRICAVSDAFDAMTSGRVYTKRAMTPDEAVRRIAQGAGSAFDPLIIRIFIGAVGVYPIGSSVQLSTGHKAVVRRNRTGDLLHPEVVVVSDAEGRRLPSAVVDLSQRDPRSGKLLRAVASPLQPDERPADPRDVLSRNPPR